MKQTNKTNLKSETYYQSIDQPGKKYECSICQKDTCGFTFILSANSIYCVSCFAKMKKWPANYHVANKLDFPVLEDSWTALQEIYLFQGLEKHGFGNWNQISEYMECNKTRDDVEKHYTNFYLSSPNFVPEQSHFLSNKANNSTQKSRNTKKNQGFPAKRIKVAIEDKINQKPQPVEIVGYMPLRKDFEYEYDNEAELLLAEMQFTEQDTQQDKELKYKILELYNKRLTERNKKKQFVFSRGILDLEKQIEFQRNVPKCDKEIYNMMKIFSRFHIASDHEELVKGIIREKQLRQKIEEYKEFRRRGFTTKAEIQEQTERKNDPKSKKKSSLDFSLGQGFGSVKNNRRGYQPNIETPLKPNIYLSKQEIELLKSLKLSNISYMMVKETLLRENAKFGSINRSAILEIFSLQKFVVNSIIDFLAKNGEIAYYY